MTPDFRETTDFDDITMENIDDFEIRDSRELLQELLHLDPELEFLFPDFQDLINMLNDKFGTNW